jgi:hypothetical protein
MLLEAAVAAAFLPILIGGYGTLSTKNFLTVNDVTGLWLAPAAKSRRPGWGILAILGKNRPRTSHHHRRHNQSYRQHQKYAPHKLRVTSIFGPEEGTWKVVHRRADPITTPQPAESVIQA